MKSTDPKIYEAITSTNQMKFFIIGKLFEEIFQDLLMVLFMCLTYIAEINIEAITKDVPTRSFQTQNVSPDCIKKWKKNYFAVQEYVKEIDRFFGPTLIITFAKISFQSILIGFKALGAVFEYEPMNPTGFIVKSTTNAFLAAGFIFAAQRMEEKVRHLLLQTKVFFSSIIEQLM